MGRIKLAPPLTLEVGRTLGNPLSIRRCYPETVSRLLRSPSFYAYSRRIQVGCRQGHLHLEVGRKRKQNASTDILNIPNVPQ